MTRCRYTLPRSFVEKMLWRAGCALAYRGVFAHGIGKFSGDRNDLQVEVEAPYNPAESHSFKPSIGMWWSITRGHLRQL